MEFNSFNTQTKLIPALFTPWIASIYLDYNPIASYFVAWTGSLVIFYLSIFSSLSPCNSQRPFRLQVMRPIILIQLIFAGFMCSSSIFYFFNQIDDLSEESILLTASDEQIMLIAQCQRYTLLAHAALVTGIVVVRPPKSLKKYTLKKTPHLVIKLAFSAIACSSILNYISGLSQFKYPLYNISIACTIYLLIRGLKKGAVRDWLPGLLLFTYQLFNAASTGYKEIIIVQFILLIFMAFPYYPKITALAAPICALLLLYILPTFTGIIRTQAWILGKKPQEARTNAYQIFLEHTEGDLILNNSKEFLDSRISEMDMFIQYVKCNTDHQELRLQQMILQSLYALIPKMIWVDKPSTEKIAMERVYRFGVVNRDSPVSAKTRPVVDGYLMGGAAGIFIYMFCYGITCQFLCNTSVKLFGGHQLGCCIIFNSIFQPLWRGNNIEFLLNNLCYGIILLLIIHQFMIITKTITKNPL